MTNPQEAELGYPLGDALPAPGRALEVAPGVHWLRMGLPFALDHVNLWLLRDRHQGREGWTVVDCGIGDAATKAAWEGVFADVLDGLPVLRVVVTHMHPDHLGLAGWLCERWSTPGQECRLWISATDYHVAQGARLPGNGFGGEAAVAHFRRHGVTDERTLEIVRHRGGDYAAMVPSLPARFRRLLDGHDVAIGGRDWRCHVGHGHAPEHIALHSPAAGVLIGGDMVLPRISTNVSVWDLEPEADALTLYLDSLARMRALPEDTLVLPSHGRPFTGLHRRIAQLERHHAERLDEVRAACAERPMSAAEIVPLMFRRPLDGHQMTFALGEALAHLNALWLGGELRRSESGEGVWRFAG